MVIGDRLRALREEKKFSQGDIEKRTGLLRCYISRVETGHTGHLVKRELAPLESSWLLVQDNPQEGSLALVLLAILSEQQKSAGQPFLAGVKELKLHP